MQTNLNGQQFMVQQQPMTNFNPQAQVVSVRTANGQIVQVPNQTSAAPQTSTMHIPGLGAVQILNASQFGTAQTAQGGAAQIMNPQAATSQFATAVQAPQQALQQDPNDPTKWHVVQVTLGRHIMLRDLFTQKCSQFFLVTYFIDTKKHVDSENIKFKIGRRSSLYQLLKKRDFYLIKCG
jgi:hypothetical protein